MLANRLLVLALYVVVVVVVAVDLMSIVALCLSILLLRICPLSDFKYYFVTLLVALAVFPLKSSLGLLSSLLLNTN